MDGTKKFNGVGYEYKGIKRVQIAGLNKVKLGRAASFKDLCIDYIRILSKENSFLRSAKIAQMKEIEPLIVEAYSQLGPQKMKALEYSKKKIEEALLVISNESSFYYKVVKLLNLRVGEWYSMVEIKSKLVQIYKQLHLNKAAKGTDLSNWFDLAPKNKRIKGKLVSGIVVTTCNVKLT